MSTLTDLEGDSSDDETCHKSLDFEYGSDSGCDGMTSKERCLVDEACRISGCAAGN